MDEFKIGDRIKDNDPRVNRDRILVIDRVYPFRVRAYDECIGPARSYRILARRIHTDGKPRRSGFTLLEPTDAQ